MREKHLIGKFILLTALLIAVILFSVAFGSVRIPIKETIQILLSKIPYVSHFIDLTQIDPSNEFIVLHLRLPRILTAGLVGAALSMTGVSFQAIFNNPMAEPYIMGVSSGAAFGATVAIILGLSGYVFGFGFVSIFAFLGAILTALFVFRMGKIKGKISTVSILLSGIVIGTILSAIINLMMMLDKENLEKIIFWTLGSFSSSSWGQLRITTIPFFIGFMILITMGKELNALVMGDELAQSMGINVEKVKLILLLLSSLLAALSVATSGIIGFVGLIIPHLFRLFIGSDHRKLLSTTFFGGAIFLILCDTIARSLMETNEIPVGIITSLFGGPFFLYLLRHSKKKITRGGLS